MSILKLGHLKYNWKNAINKVVCADCMDMMRMIPDRAISLIVTDPPYKFINLGGTGSYLSESTKKIYTELEDMRDGFDIERTFSEFKRILKLFNLFCFCSNAQISSIMKWGEKNGYITTCLVWHKYNAVPFCHGVWKSDIEFIIHIREKGAHFVGDSELKSKVFKYPIVPNQEHPTEKPKRIIRNMLKVGCPDGGIVLDPFAGSFTTAIACQEMEVDWICCDWEEKYCQIGRDRLAHKPLFAH